MAPGGVPTYEVMNAQRPKAQCWRLGAIAVAAAVATVLAGCGTPAVVKPGPTPLPGFNSDIQAAQNAVAQTQAQAQGDGATGATLP
jgi:anti-sigma-K factor RskA